MLLVAFAVTSVTVTLMVVEGRRIRGQIVGDRAGAVARAAAHVENETDEAAANAGRGARGQRRAAIALLQREAINTLEELGAKKIVITGPDATIIAHSEPEHVGEIHGGEEVAEVLATGVSVTEPEGASEFAFAVPFRFRGGRPGAFEAEVDLPALETAIASARREALLPSLAIMALVLPLASYIANRFMVRANEREQRAEARFRSRVQNSSDVTLQLDSAGTIVYVSPAVQRVLGHEPEALLGTRLSDLVHPDHQEALAATFAELLHEESGTRAAEARLRHADRSWHWVGGVATNMLGDSTVGGVVINLRDVSDRKVLEASLSHQAFHDPLTGLANRALFQDRIEHALARRRQQGQSVAVLFIDLDDFKTINDSLGHAAGDQLLVAVSKRIQPCLRPVDTLARLGGDEFAILLEDMRHSVDAVGIAERITQGLKGPFNLESKQLSVHASIGIVTDLSPEMAADELVGNADTAMYVAKSKGKDRFEIFEPHMHQTLMQRLDLKADLQHALENKELVVFYQPIVELESGKLTGAEALVRWIHPERGLIPPLEFIPLAEDTGFILPLGLWVLQQACAQAKQWQEQYGDLDFMINVNVSALQLQEPGFVEDVAEAVRQTALDPSTLTLELTESVLTQDVDLVVDKFHSLKRLGVRIAIDDFGTGYSSLGYLQRFPIDTIKIDKSFIDRLGRASGGSALVQAIIAMSRTFNLKAIAEGIESEGQVSMLRELGCPTGQGYHFAKPVGADQMSALLGDRLFASVAERN